MIKNKVECRVCGSRNNSKYFYASDLNQNRSSDSFLYYRCSDCLSIFIADVPENMGLYYSQDYPAYAVKNTQEIEDNLNYLECQKLEIVKKYAPLGRLVEVGPAAGRFLSLANSSGYQVLGIEQDAGCVEYIKDTLKLDVKYSNKPADDLLKIVACCDVIVAWHVIEHLQELKEFVSAASKTLCRPNGVIIVSAPNPEAWSFRLFGRYWVHLDAPRHLTLIPLKALDKIMVDQGLERVACIFDDPVGMQLNRVGWQISLMNLSRNKKIRQPWLAGLGKILSVVMLWFDKITGSGAAYTVIYKIIDNAKFETESSQRG